MATGRARQPRGPQDLGRPRLCMLRGRRHACPGSFSQLVALELSERRHEGEYRPLLGPVVLMPSVTLGRCKARCSSSSIEVSRLQVLRPNRSSFHTTTSSPLRRWSRSLSSSYRLPRCSAHPVVGEDLRTSRGDLSATIDGFLFRRRTTLCRSRYRFTPSAAACRQTERPRAAGLNRARLQQSPGHLRCRR
jgi:hypothetical protein